MYDSRTVQHCCIFLNTEISNSPGTYTNHQSVINISSFASSIAFATSSKYPLALTYLKDTFSVSFFLTKKIKKEISHMAKQKTEATA